MSIVKVNSLVTLFNVVIVLILFHSITEIQYIFNSRKDVKDRILNYKVIRKTILSGN